MKRRYVQCPVTGNLIPVEDYVRDPASAMVMPDIKPYRSMADGSVVGSRSAHREMLKRNGCFEVGNELPMTPRGIPDVDAGGRKELIASQMRELGHDGFKRALKRDTDFIKWNSRGLERSK